MWGAIDVCQFEHDEGRKEDVQLRRQEEARREVTGRRRPL